MRKLILFGDSITAGYANDFVSPILTKKLATYFPEEIILNVGIPGDTTVDGIARLEKHVLSKQPDFVTVFFGSNDASTGLLVPIDEYRLNLTKMIETIGASKVILITPALSNQALQQAERPNSRLIHYGNVVRELATQYQTQLAELQLAMLDRPNYLDCLQEDGFHFSEIGYDVLAEEIAKAIKA
ncbi:GDSL-type esterase/lipase family protein [Carnobacterium divergens]|uniref:Lipase n=1 Tax=Carnobacterium divergens TaxID=2748 RepID=A0A7Z8CZF5_CARDV|nr:GDSL-type esterase/lipase family protein [Carnobacterium divergens]TFI72683.1 lipase [Carnobacterium divergens]TFI77122.1 lipase [Carnobacterium divergens]TFI83423.1 lipase [Carnobacterium divergens]TFI95528.1 lipase [Carnobacterium divergens]TFJ11888.1 lipase [Carnobacterium divergens]